MSARATKKQRGESTPLGQTTYVTSKPTKGKGRQIDTQEEQTEEIEHASDPDEVSDGESDSSDEGEQGAPLDLDKIRRRMHHAQRQMTQKAKQARKFEIQRIVKRLKSCPETERADLEAQLTCLKTLSLSPLAATALLGKLGKAKLIPRGAAVAGPYKTADAKAEAKGVDEWPVMAGVWSEETIAQIWLVSDSNAGASTPEGKVRAKILSHKLLAEESARLTEVLGRLAGREKKPAAVVEASNQSAAAVASVDDDKDRQYSGSEGEDDGEQSGLESDSESEDDEEREFDEAAFHERMEELGNLDQWDAMVAAGSDDEDEGEDSADEAESSKAPAERKRKRQSTRSQSPPGKQERNGKNPRRGGSPSSSSEEGHSDDDDDSESESDAPSASSASSASSTNSHFLPSLSHGFITHSLRTKDDDFSGSEGEGGKEGASSSDIDSDAEDRVQGAAKGSKKSSQARKNRMGQRARKALWEKKYGRNANHVKLRAKEDKKKSSSATAGTPFKPLRRGRDGKVLPEFKAPEQTDTGWKRFPVATTPADSSQSESPASTQRKAMPPQRSTSVVGAGAPRAKYSTAPNAAAAPPATKQPASQQHEMHPSWVAKQKQKEKEEMIARSLQGGGGGAGKKVVFD